MALEPRSWDVTHIRTAILASLASEHSDASRIYIHKKGPMRHDAGLRMPLALIRTIN
jgi:hypothetical protein